MSTPQDRAAFFEVPGSRLREMRDAAADLDTAIRLLEAALFLRHNGERPPGGKENWAQWEREAETFLRSRLDAAAGDAETAELERRQRVYERQAYGGPGIRL